MRKAIAVVLVLLGVLCCFAAGAESCTHKFNADGMCTICGYQCPHDTYGGVQERTINEPTYRLRTARTWYMLPVRKVRRWQATRLRGAM